VNSITPSTSTSSGALIVAGGLGLAGRLNVGGATILTTITGTDGTLSGTLNINGALTVNNNQQINYQGQTLDNRFTNKGVNDIALAAIQTDLNNKATITYVNNAIANVIDNSPEALNTLLELADALGNNENFATNTLQLIGTKASSVDLQTTNNAVALNTAKVGITSAQISKISTNTADISNNTFSIQVNNNLRIDEDALKLNLTGGTLTGALIGTTATLSGSLNVGGATTLTTITGTNGTFSGALNVFGNTVLSNTNINGNLTVNNNQQIYYQEQTLDNRFTNKGVNDIALSEIQTALNLKANIASPTFTGTVTGITKVMVGLGNVDNTSDIAKPISTLAQIALNLKANIESPTFTGTVTGIDKAMVGLGNVDNTTDAAKPISTLAQTALNLKANIESPTFTGNVTVNEIIYKTETLDTRFVNQTAYSENNTAIGNNSTQLADNITAINTNITAINTNITAIDTNNTATNALIDSNNNATNASIAENLISVNASIATNLTATNASIATNLTATNASIATNLTATNASIASLDTRVVTNTTNLADKATTAYVDTAVANIVNGSPVLLDTLFELALALDNKPDFANEVLALIGTNTAGLENTNNLIGTRNSESIARDNTLTQDLDDAILAIVANNNLRIDGDALKFNKTGSIFGNQETRFQLNPTLMNGNLGFGSANFENIVRQFTTEAEAREYYGAREYSLFRQANNDFINSGDNGRQGTTHSIKFGYNNNYYNPYSDGAFAPTSHSMVFGVSNITDGGDNYLEPIEKMRINPNEIITSVNLNVNGSANISGGLSANSGYFAGALQSDGIAQLGNYRFHPNFFQVNNVDFKFAKWFSGETFMTIKYDSGNVGIGTENPTAKLDVNGTAKISGALTVGSTNTINNTLQARYIRFQRVTNILAGFNLSEIRVFGTNGLQLNNSTWTVAMSSQLENYAGSNLIDENLASFAHTASDNLGAFMEVDMKALQTFSHFLLFNRVGFFDRAIGLTVILKDNTGNVIDTPFLEEDAQAYGIFSGTASRVITSGNSTYTFRNLLSLDVKGSAKMSGSLEIQAQMRCQGLAGSGNRNVVVNFNGIFIALSSDRRLKENFEPINESETHLKLLKLEPKTYQWTDREKYGDYREIGMIAQEVKEVLPELVFENNNGMYGLHYDKVSILMLQSIKQLQKQIDELKNEIIQLKK
jgi:hypothetical protein